MFQDFLRDCVAYEGDAAGALQAAAQRGWTPIPQDKLPSALPVPGLKTETMQGYIGQKPGQSLGLVVTRGEMKLDLARPAIPIAVCMLIQKPIDPLSMQRAGTWTNARALPFGADATIYWFTSTPTGSRPAALDQIANEFERGHGRELVTMTRPSEDSAAIAMITPVRAAAQGSAALSCTVAADGTLSGCSITAEQPMGRGYAAAALRQARTMRVDHPQAGARIVVPFTFDAPPIAGAPHG
jgi:hypothetical protein